MVLASGNRLTLRQQAVEKQKKNNSNNDSSDDVPEPHMTSYEPTEHVSCIARDEVQMETRQSREEFLNFHLIGNWNKSQERSH